MFSKKKLNPKVTDLFIKDRRRNAPLIFITQSYFAVPKSITINSTHDLIMKIPKKQEFQQI